MQKYISMMVLLLVTACWAVGVAGNGDWDIPKDPSKFHIFIFAGQSNMAGGFKDSYLYDDEGNYDPLNKPVPRILLYKRGGWVPAAHPVESNNGKNSFSMPIPFAQKYLEEINDPEVKVGIYVDAMGGKAINFFVKGGTMHPSGTAGLPKHGTVKGFIWHQGESDNRLEEREAYAQKLHSLVRDVRGYVGNPDLPFITGAFNPKWEYSNPYSIPPGAPAAPEAKDLRGSYEAQITTGNVLAHIDVLNKAAHVQSTGASNVTQHKRKLVDKNGKLTGETEGVPSDNTHFNRSGYTTLAHRYVDLILDRPAFKADPVIMVAVPGRKFTFDLRTAACDLSKDKLRFTAEKLPEWVKMDSEGILTGTAPAEGTNTFSISVTDKSGYINRSHFEIVAIPAGAPKFKAKEYSRKAAVPGQLYEDRVYYHYRKPASSDVIEPNNETVIFSKVDGPAWLKVGKDGTLSGTPTAADAEQTQKLTVKAADVDGEDTAVYSIPVLKNGYVWHENFEYQPDIPWLAAGDKLIFNKDMPKDTWFIWSGHFPFTYTTQYSCYDVAGSLKANSYKFGTGALRGIAFVLNGRRFGGQAGKVRFNIDLSDVEKGEPTGRGANVQARRAKKAEALEAAGKIKEGERHFFVSLYQLALNDAAGDAVEVVLGNDNLYSKNAEVKTRGTAKLTPLASRDFKPTEQGVQTLEFNYDGTGDILLVLSAVNDKGVEGGGRNFDNLSFQAMGK